MQRPRTRKIQVVPNHWRVDCYNGNMMIIKAKSDAKVWCHARGVAATYGKDDQFKPVAVTPATKKDVEWYKAMSQGPVVELPDYANPKTCKHDWYISDGIFDLTGDRQLAYAERCELCNTEIWYKVKGNEYTAEKLTKAQVARLRKKYEKK